MPYITQANRQALKYHKPQTAGELNYIITKIILDFVGDEPWRYALINEVVGVLECAKQELYRRIAAPYEDAKAKENGDIYE